MRKIPPAIMALKMKKGTIRHGMQGASTRKRQPSRFLPFGKKPPERNETFPYLDFRPVRPVLDF